MNDLYKLLQSQIKQLATVKANFPKLAANAARNHFLDNFKSQSYLGVPWPKRKNNKDPDRALLVDSGVYKKSVQVKEAHWTRAVIGSDVKYAAYNNDGTDKIPKRTAIGPDPKLDVKIITLLGAQVNTAFK